MRILRAALVAFCATVAGGAAQEGVIDSHYHGSEAEERDATSRLTVKEAPTLMSFLTDPARIAEAFEAPPYDVSVDSRGGRVHVSFCNSWQYRGGFVQIKRLLADRYPGVPVVGSNYPVPPLKIFLAQLVTLLQVTICLLALFGEGACELLKIDPPDWLRSMAENRTSTCLFAWFLGNTVAQNMTNTGAFEIAYNGKMVFSKLDASRMPTVKEIMDGVAAIQSSITHSRAM
jgi:selT/selW/selH-like putative selenoprotein